LKKNTEKNKQNLIRENHQQSTTRSLNGRFQFKSP
jgi:hypothetical protein